jgi:hypothetical protein
MAIAYTNHGAAAASSTAATTTGAKAITAVAGDTIIVGVALASGGSAPTVTDSAGNTYTQQLTNSNTSGNWMFTARNVPGAVTSVTVSWTGSAKWAVTVDTYSGVMGFGLTGSAALTSAAPSVSLAGLGTGNWMVAVMMSNATTATWSANVGNLRRNIAGASTSSPGSAIMDNTTTTCTATLSLSKQWATLGIELLSVAPAVSVQPTVAVVGQAVNRGATV